VSLRPLPPLVLMLALLVACGSGDGDGEGPAGHTDGGTGHTAGTTGEPAGAVTQAQADRAMGGLCDIATGAVTDTGDILEAFHSRAHEILHQVATEAQAIDPVVAGALLEAKSVVETDLEQAPFPAELPSHAEALVAAYADALEAVGLQAVACG